MSPEHPLTPLFKNAGVPLDKYDEVVEGINNFTTMMVVLIESNKEIAPNYITFAMNYPDGDAYELTIRKSDGITPCDKIDELQNTVDLSKKLVREWLGEDEEGNATESFSTTSQLVTGLRELLKV